MLDDLVRTVEKLRERIDAHRDQIETYEIRTRASLIDPMLHALGWEVGDPAQVTVEREVADAGRPDYALLGETGQPVLFIEAKKLKVTRGPVAQVVSYVSAANMDRADKVPFCAWTNGDVWEVFDVLKQNRVLDAQLSRDAPADCAFKLLALWRRSLVDSSLRTPVGLPARKRTAKRRVEPPNQDSQDAGEPRAGHARTLANFDTKTDPVPTSIAFPGEAALPLRKQKDLIVAVANHLVRTNRLTRSNGTLRSGAKRHIVHSLPKHPNGGPFKSSVTLDNGLHLETANSFGQTVTYAHKLLDHYGVAGLAGRVKLGP